MELVFFWVKKYGKIESENFNFNPEFQFSYKEEKELAFKKIGEAVNIFAENNSNISNVTAIVGKNGSGKTTLIKAIINIYIIEAAKDQNAKPYIIIFFQPATEKKPVGTFFIQSNINLEQHIEKMNKDEAYDFCFNTKSKTEKSPTKDMYMVHYTNAFSCPSYVESFRSEGNFYNLALMQGIQAAQREQVESLVDSNEIDPVLSFFHKSTQIQLAALKSADLPFKVSSLGVKKIQYWGIIQNLIKNEFSDITELSDIRTVLDELINEHKYDESKVKAIPKLFEKLLARIGDIKTNQKIQSLSNEINLRFENVENSDPDDIVGKIKSFQKIKEKLDDFFIKVDIENKTNEIFETIINRRLSAANAQFCLEAVLSSLARRIIPLLSGQMNIENYKMIKKILEAWEEIIRNNKKNSSDDIFFIMQFVNVTMRMLKPSEKNKIITAYEKTIRFFLEDDIAQYNSYTGMYLLNLNNENDIEKIIAFYDNYLETVGHIYDYFLFEWKMSTGEISFFDLYATFYELGQKIQRQERQCGTGAQSMLILIDEADLYLHPKWQQEFVKRMLDTMTSIFKGKKIQIIFATHSPIFLSDIPNHHIIYLAETADNILVDTSKRINKKTFAANIYNLYNDSFFLNDNKNIGIIGNYSDGIIKKLRENLESINKDLNNYEDDRKHEIQPLSNSEYVSECRCALEKNKKIIDLIGEPLIKNMLWTLWESANAKLSACFDDHAQNSKAVIEKFKELTQDEQVKVMEFIIRNHEYLGEMK